MIRFADSVMLAKEDAERWRENQPPIEEGENANSEDESDTGNQDYG